MASIVMEREFADPVTPESFVEMTRKTAGCLDVYRASWQESLISEDGLWVICRYTAPDEESIRQLTRGDACVRKALWPGDVTDTGRVEPATVVVERRFEKPVTLESIQALEDAGAWCLELHRVNFLRTFFSSDRSRMICLYAAPDAESVRLAQHQAGMPVERIWACRGLAAADLA